MAVTDNQVIKRASLLVATMASFLTPFMASSVNIALPNIGKEFNMDAVALGWIPTSYLLAAAIFLVPFGRIADIHGRRKILTWGIFIYTISSILSALAQAAVPLICFRLIQGVGAAMIFGTSVAILTSVFPVNERGKVLGINVASVYIGQSIGPTLGGLMTEHFGWRSIFLLTAVLGATVIVVILWKLKGDWAEARGEKFDLAGSTIYGLALAAIMYGFSLLPASSGGWLIGTGTLGILAFVRWEMRATSPVLSVNLFAHNPVFSLSSLAALINYSATFAVGFLLSLYLQYIKGFRPDQAGLILISQPLVQAILSPGAGRLSDRIEPRILASIGMALTTASLLLFSFLNQDTSVVFILMTLVMLGLGFAFFSSPNTNAIMSSVDRKFYGIASGVVGTMRLTGQMLSLGIVMLVLALYMGKEQITPAYYPLFLKSTRIAFAIMAILCFGGIFASLARGKVR